MLLTIGMIVKNEEKYLRKCLEALQPILKSISSELIIVDTGSTDRTVEIAKEFTDKVYFFEWINDFSAARNCGLEKAQGEWFMSVDADEIFISCDEIIYFFQSGNYKEYNSASFFIRNLSAEDKSGRTADFYAPRLTRMLPETKFVNAVHEVLNTYGQPICLLQDVAEHYGYIANVGDEKKTRNYELLKKRLDSGEESASLYRELFDALSSKKDEESKQLAYGYLRKGIEISERDKHDYILALYHCGITAYTSQGRYEEAVKLYEEYIVIDNSIKNGVRSTDLDIYAFSGIAFYSLRRFEEAYKIMNKYFDLYDHIQRNKLYTRDAIYTNRYMSDEKGRTEINLYYVICCLETGRLKEAEKSLREYPSSAYKDNKEYYFARINQAKRIIREYTTEEFTEKLTKGDAKLQAELFRGFRSMVFDMPADERRRIIEKLSTANLKSAAQRKLTSIYMGHFLGNGAGDALLIEYADKFGMDYPDLFIIMDRECMNAMSYLSKCDDVEFFIGIGLNSVDRFQQTMAALNFENVARGDIYNSVTACFGVITGLLSSGYSAASLYNPVGNLGIRYLEAFGESNIPAEIMAAVTIAEINLLRSGRNFKGCLDAMRRLIQMNKKYAPIVSEYQNLIKTDIATLK